MIQNQPIRIAQKRVFICYSFCQDLDSVADVLVELPEIPIPGALFQGEFFLSPAHQKVMTSRDKIFMVKDILHRFTSGVQHVIIVLEAIPRYLFLAARHFAVQLS